MNTQRLLSAIPNVQSWWLDVKLGIRMLGKYPGLALAGGVGIAVAVAISTAGYSALRNAFMVSTLPLEEGDRIVSLEIWDPAANGPQRHLQHDFHAWRTQLQSVRELSAFRTLTPNLFVPGAQPGIVRVAAMTASGFNVARVRPLMGRYLNTQDEHEAAPAVVVIGENVWRNRFAADPAILGKNIQLGSAQYAVVGIMPDAFTFPVNHRFWIPLRLGVSAPEPRTGPELMVFGRLSPGATLETAQAELKAVTARTAQAYPELYARLRPSLMPFAYPFSGFHRTEDLDGLAVMQGLTASLFLLVLLNIAILVYSRTAMRQGEIAVRTALGAGRARIVAQLFLEAFVLATVAAAIGVGIAAFALQRISVALQAKTADLPFWVSLHLSPSAVLAAGVLTVCAAAVIGVVPALMATNREVQTGLRVIGAGGSGMRLGRTWTVLIVAQVGFAVALLPAAVFSVTESVKSGLSDPGFAAREFLSAKLDMDEAPDRAPLFAARQSELIRRLEVEPQVTAVTYSRVHPGGEQTAGIETETDSTGLEARFNRVDPAFFRTFEVPILAGRAFEPADATPTGNAIIVNQTFAQRIFGGNALGRRIRYTRDGENGRWYEIVGIVTDFPAAAGSGMGESKLRFYHAAAPGQLPSVNLALRIRGGDPVSFVPRLREIAAAVDPDLQIPNPISLEEAFRQEQWIRLMEGAVFAAITLSVLLLSAAGIYALMSITVSQRRKEIGIRAALGAGPRRLVAGIFARAFGQLAIGAALGMAVAAALDRAVWGDVMQGHAVVVLPIVALLVVAVGMLGVFGPARRSLRIQPTEALRQQ